MALWRVGSLPDDALAAAAQFHAQMLPCIREELGRSPHMMTLVFMPTDHTHRGWRLAMVQGLAREHAPLRINALESDDEVAIAAGEAYLAAANGVTGQLLPLDSVGAGKVLQ